MNKLIRVLIASISLLALCVSAASADSGPSNHSDKAKPKVDSRPAAPVFDTTANLRARIELDDEASKAGGTTYRFQYGPSAAVAVTTAAGTIPAGSEKTSISTPVSGLTPSTTYYFRAVASNSAGTTYGPTTSFKTLKSPAGPKDGQPERGHTVAAETMTGTVLVREQGSTEFHALSDTEEMPVGTTFDTSNGTVMLEAAGPGGDTYKGSFHGGTFRVHQSQGGKGVTRIALRGGNFSACGSSRKGRATASSAHPVLRKLWGKDHGGRFKTSSRGSVATVRGTEWLTVDHCDGTLTRVTKGKVLVRERGTGRSKLLHKGESFFAHLPH